MEKKTNLEPTEGRSWLVMRMAPARTLPLVEALVGRGIEAWTPLWRRRQRLPRSTKTHEVLVPALPSFAFLPKEEEWPARELSDLFRVPRFRLMEINGVKVRVEDRALVHLRELDKDVRTAPPVRFPQAGDRMRFSSGPFQGLEALVVGREGGWSMVQLPHFNIPVKVPPFLLERIERYSTPAERRSG